MQSANNRRLWVILIFFISIVLPAVGAGIYFSSRHSGNAPTSFTDSFSHQTISNPAGKTPETYGSNPNTPIFPGFDSLLNRGMTFHQLGNLKQAFYDFSKSQKTNYKIISLDVDHINNEHSNGTFLLVFKVQIDEKAVYLAKVDYTGLTAIRLYLYDQSGTKVVYDSKVVDPIISD